MRGSVSRCDLEVRLDEPGAVFRPGDAITGEVIVRVHEEGRCDGLALACRWFTHGDGNVDRGDASVETLFKGEWSRGEHRYRFSVTAPRGPMSCEAATVAVRWCMAATADLPWARDPSASCEFRLVPREDATLEEPYFFGSYYGVVEKAQGRKETISTTPTGLPDPSRNSPWVWPLLVIVLAGMLYLLPVLLLVGVPLMALSFGRTQLVRLRLGRPALRVEPRVMCPGGAVEATVVIEPPVDVHVDECYVSLTAEARAVKGSGRGSRTTTVKVHEKKVPLEFARQVLRKGQRVEVTVTLGIPPEGPYTFAASDNRITWKIEASVDVPWWPAWVDDLVLDVRPGRALVGGYRGMPGPG